MVNRRAHRRTKVLRTVVIEPLATARRSRWVFGADNTGPAAGKMVDVGCGGMSAELSLKLEVGTSCDVRIEGTSGKVQRTRGTVRNVRGGNGIKTLGIAFTEHHTPEMIRKIEEAFRGWEKREVPVSVMPEVNYEFRQTVNFVQKDDVNQTNICPSVLEPR